MMPKTPSYMLRPEAVTLHMSVFPRRKARAMENTSSSVLEVVKGNLCRIHMLRSPQGAGQSPTRANIRTSRYFDQNMKFSPVSEQNGPNSSLCMHRQTLQRQLQLITHSDSLRTILHLQLPHLLSKTI